MLHHMALIFNQNLSSNCFIKNIQWLLRQLTLEPFELADKLDMEESREPLLVEPTASHWNFHPPPPFRVDFHQKCKILHANCDVTSYCDHPLITIRAFILNQQKCKSTSSEKESSDSIITVITIQIAGHFPGHLLHCTFMVPNGWLVLSISNHKVHNSVNPTPDGRKVGIHEDESYIQIHCICIDIYCWWFGPTMNCLHISQGICLGWR